MCINWKIKCCNYLILHSYFCCNGSCILLRFFFQNYPIIVHLIALMSMFLFPTQEQILELFCVSLKVSCIVVSFRNILCTLEMIKCLTARHSEQKCACPFIACRFPNKQRNSSEQLLHCKRGSSFEFHCFTVHFSIQ